MKEMLFKIADTFNIRGRDVVIAADREVRDRVVRVGDGIEIRLADGSVFPTKVAGIEILCPPPPDRRLAILLPLDINKEDVPKGVEVWSLRDRAV